jgi:rod shape-determining protein MreD
VRLLAGAALMAAAALAQVTWAPHFEVGGAFPNLVLLGVVGVTWTRGQRHGMAWACVGGLLLDLTASGPVGPHAIALLVGAYVIGFWTRDLQRQAAVHVVLTAVAGTVLYSAGLVLTDGLLGLPVPQPGTAVWLAFTAAVYNALLIPFALDLIRRLQALTQAAPQPD